MERSHTGIIHILNKTSIDWYYKLQHCVETATYGSKYAAALICTDHIFDPRNTLRYLGVPLQMVNISDALSMFGNKCFVDNNTVVPAVKSNVSLTLSTIISLG